MARAIVALLVLAVAPPAPPQGFPYKMSIAGDSLSQGALADGVLPFDQPWNSWAQGVNGDVSSVWSRYRAHRNPAMLVQPVSQSGAEMIDDFVAQAGRICSQWIRPNRVFVLLGQNDACRSPRSPTDDAAALMPPADVFAGAVRGGLARLAACLPRGSIVQVVSVIRVDFLFEAGISKNLFYCPAVWQALDTCRIVTGEADPARRARVGARVDEWNAAVAAEVAAFDANVDGRNPRAIRFVSDWEGSTTEGKENTSAGTYRFGPSDINALDCFHASTGAQRKLACLEWAKSPDGFGSPAQCLQ